MSLATTKGRWVHIIDSSNTYPAEVDSNGFLKVAGPARSSLNRGYMFHAGVYTASLGVGNTALLTLTAPASGKAHCVFGIATSGAGQLEIWEDSTALLSGAITPRNLDRNSITAATVVAYGNLTSSALANSTRLVQRPVAATSGQRLTGDVHEDAEWVLAQGKNYLVHFTATASGNCSLKAEWYEVI